MRPAASRAARLAACLPAPACRLLLPLRGLPHSLDPFGSERLELLVSHVVAKLLVHHRLDRLRDCHRLQLLILLHFLLHNLHGCPTVGSNPIWHKADRNKVSRGKFNLGGYCNAEVDGLTARILSETDQAKRATMISDAWAITIGEIAHIPLHQQALSWGVRDGVELMQRADNEFAWRHVRLK